MDYKEKTEEFIKDLNLLLGDNLFCPNDHGGRFEVKFIDGMSIEGDAIECYVGFKQGDTEHCISRVMVSPKSQEDLDMFYSRCYWQTFRTILFTKDYFGKLKEPGVEGGSVLNFLSLETLFNEGLNKLVTNK